VTALQAKTLMSTFHISALLVDTGGPPGFITKRDFLKVDRVAGWGAWDVECIPFSCHVLLHWMLCGDRVSLRVSNSSYFPTPAVAPVQVSFSRNLKRTRVRDVMTQPVSMERAAHGGVWLWAAGRPGS
jgi:hypothetical protein